jgi:hypothetical protein
MLLSAFLALRIGSGQCSALALSSMLCSMPVFCRNIYLAAAMLGNVVAVAAVCQ